MSYFFETASARSLPGEKRTRSFAATWRGGPLRVLTPLRAALRRTLNEPKPTRRTSLPFWSESSMAARVASSTSAAFFCVNPAFEAIARVISCRPVMVAVLPAVFPLFDVGIERNPPYDSQQQRTSLLNPILLLGLGSGFTPHCRYGV